MIPGVRGIFGAIGSKISEKYDIPIIFVEWVAIFVFWILYVIFNPDPFSSFDVYALIAIYILSFVIYFIVSIAIFRNLDLLKNAFKKPSVETKEFHAELEQIKKQNQPKKRKKKK